MVKRNWTKGMRIRLLLSLLLCIGMATVVSAQIGDGEIVDGGDCGIECGGGGDGSGDEGSGEGDGGVGEIGGEGGSGEGEGGGASGEGEGVGEGEGAGPAESVGGSGGSGGGGSESSVSDTSNNVTEEPEAATEQEAGENEESETVSEEGEEESEDEKDEKQEKDERESTQPKRKQEEIGTKEEPVLNYKGYNLLRKERARLFGHKIVRTISARLQKQKPRPRDESEKTQEIGAQSFEDQFKKSGLSSGNSPQSGISVWSDFSLAYLDIRKSTYEADMIAGALTVGIDRLVFADQMVVGLALGYEYSDGDLNDKDFEDRGNGGAFTPFLVYQPVAQLSLQALGNVTYSKYEEKRNTDDYYGTRIMADLSAHYDWGLEKSFLVSELGVMVLNENYDDNLPDSEVAELRLGVRWDQPLKESLSMKMRAVYYQELVSEPDEGFDSYSFEAMIGGAIIRGAYSLDADIFTEINGDRSTFGTSLLFRYEF